MILRPATIYGDAWAAWRRDWQLLTAVAGMFVFLPQLALLLLVPDSPDLSAAAGADPGDPAFQAALAALEAWVGKYGLFYVAVAGAALYGQFALVALYLTPGRATVGRALTTALTLVPRLLLASIVWMLPLGLLGVILARVPFVVLPVLALVMGRMLLVGPAILAARPIGAVGAIGRSVRLTSGHMLLLASIVLTVVLAQYLMSIPLLTLDHWMTAHAPNPIARIIVDALTAAVAALGAIAMALVQVAAWGRLNRP